MKIYDKKLAYPYFVWMVLFTVVPLFIVVYYAMTDAEGNFTLNNLTSISGYGSVFARSLLLALIATVICLIIAFPVGYFLSRLRVNKQHIMLMLVMLPMWMNFLLRTYAHRTEVDLASYCEGTEPQADDEVAIDRVFATNNDLAVGDTVELEGRAYTICGIMTQPDSQALFLDNSDFTINTVTYGEAEVSDTGFAALEDAGGAPTYTYSFVFNNRGLSVADRTDAEKDMVDALTDADARVDDLIDADSNQGIGYARDDVDGDSVMWTTP